MPYCRIETNVAADKVTPQMAEELGKLVAKTTGKPLSYCAGAIVPGVPMSFGGDAATPCAQAVLMSIGCLGGDLNKRHSKAIADFTNKTLGVAPDRMYIQFVDAAGSNVGFNGNTF
ncbi:macrophage migration inhibitory factor [Gregarina niphandrodes]|uniref:L-dopachrome isomerase n=1 Tax=Gregarina niphandrodes TaxID=110365 RepID=A0A023B961_GRENI|nr:macrophage migration inhibitory factor [Gregarina niphandrodes]EZG70939.1 macrophage migration inhibitory factor [Gregarina niphandrodes]|eukprot:XP_011129854.1 macrophage migration inhibitory factor [Gregarina niphandrodes]